MVGPELGSDAAAGSVDRVGTGAVVAAVDVPRTAGELEEVETGATDCPEFESGVDDTEPLFDAGVVVACGSLTTGRFAIGLD